MRLLSSEKSVLVVVLAMQNRLIIHVKGELNCLENLGI